jgi:serine/threonine protein kinase
MNEVGMDRTMPEKCPQCGASLPAGALAGLCPACLLQQGAAADTATRPNAKPFEPPSVEEVARLFPQLEILGFLGKGGMGAVYKARQPALDRFVALKILPAQAAPDPGFTERFTREARALARLSHPNIVAVFEFGQVNASSAGVPSASGASVPPASGAGVPPAGSAGVSPALPYFIMEFVDGVNLRQLQKTGRLSPREALQIVPQICDALQYAHDEGVVHRDIKPENVLVDRKGRVKIADFGLAKILGREPEALRLTGEGQVMGTPHYMAPEQVEHPLAVDHRADIFSLGVVFYEMLTGELPLGKFQPPSCKVQVDVRLDDVVLHALEKEPERRYQHVSEVKTDMQKIASGTPLPGQAPGQPVEARRLKKINCVPALSLYCVTTALLVAANWRELRGYKDFFLAPYAAVAWIVGCVFWSIMHYSCWQALPEKYRATTPGRALGFLFIPLFNFYWFFVSFPILATGFNALKRERPELPIRNLRGVGIAYAITTVLVFTVALNHPGWACLIFVTDLVLTFVFYLGIVANANVVIEASQPARSPAAAASQRTALSEPPPSGGRAWKIAAAVIVAVVALNCVIAFLAFRPALSKSPPAGLVSWWRAEGDASDAFGTNNGVLRGGAGFTRGKVGQAFSFDGSDGSVLVPDSSSLRLTNQLTIEAWINTRRIDTDQAIVSKVGGRAGDNGYQFALSGNTLIGQFNSPGERWPSARVTSDEFITTGAWYHVAWTYDQSAMKLYVNGLPVATSVIGRRPIAASTSDLRISGDDNKHVYFDGLIDEPAIYNRALSDAEIAAIYHAGSAGKNGQRNPGDGLSASFRPALSKPPPDSGAPMAPLPQKGITPPPGLVAWWPLDGHAADVVGDRSGTLEGSYHFGPAEVGQGLYLEGERSGISVPDSPDLNFGPDQDFSIEAWIQPLHSDTTSGVMDIVDKRIAPDIVRSHGYTMSVMNGKLSFQISDSLDAPMLSWEQNGPDLRDGVWHHVAATVERASAEGVKLYVDGEVIATFDPTPARGDLSTEQPLLIGMHQSYPWYRGNYRGGLDEVSLYKRALSPAEILAIYNAGKNGKRKPGHKTRVESLERHP